MLQSLERNGAYLEKVLAVNADVLYNFHCFTILQRPSAWETHPSGASHFFFMLGPDNL